MSRIFVFPGQGSQKKGMGQDLFPRFPDLVKEADEVLGYSLAKLCLEDEERLQRTDFTQPALYMVNALSFLALIEDGTPWPDFVAGHSLGEYNALFVAGVFDLMTGLRLVQRRGALMAQATGGGMAAVLGLDEATVRKVLADHGLTSIDVANFNAPTQIVVSGPAADVQACEAHFKAAGARLVVVLKVSGAFHSRYMTPAATQFGEFLAGAEFAKPTVPVIANYTAQPYAADAVRENLTRQMDHSVRWVESMRYLLQQPDPQVTEIGPGRVLTGLLKQIAGK